MSLWRSSVSATSAVSFKVLVNCDWVIALYVLNLAMVAFDLFLYYRYLNLARGLRVPVDCASG